MKAKLGSAMRIVGAEILRCREEGRTSGEWQGAQFKAAADLIADEVMRKELHQIADLPIISEEDIASQSSERPYEYWLIDPIDGTASFAHGFSGFVCQAALMKDKSPYMTAVYAPALDKLYVAERGHGVTLNGHPISVRAVDRQKLTLVDNYPEPRGIAEYVYRELSFVNYLESGSIGLKICLVAEGAADIFVKDVCVRDWDIAAPHLVLHEAGGALLQINGQSYEYDGNYEKQGMVSGSSAELIHGIVGIAANYAQQKPTTI